MRFMVVLAGAFGFIVALAGGVIGGKPIEVCLIGGLITGFVAGILVRWWLRIWIRSLEQISMEDELASKLQEMESEPDPQQSAENTRESRKLP